MSIRKRLSPAQINRGVELLRAARRTGWVMCFFCEQCADWKPLLATTDGNGTALGLHLSRLTEEDRHNIERTLARHNIELMMCDMSVSNGQPLTLAETREYCLAVLPKIAADFSKNTERVH